MTDAPAMQRPHALAARLRVPGGKALQTMAEQKKPNGILGISWPVIVIVALGMFLFDLIVHIPGFLEAQTRSKVSMVKANLRTLLAQVEEGKTPSMLADPFLKDGGKLQLHDSNLGWVLSGVGPDKKSDFASIDFASTTSETLQLLEYNPTNGTISSGDIYMVVPKQVSSEGS
ncbi:MAG: hypothetical protein PWP23_2915 [Candidatus Sumerlaeota bacterium]|nr:hypothetical protein [Candidatus Sumerlaeota bacterium]